MLSEWITQSPRKMLSVTIPLIIIGCASYGLTMGLWQGWEMASYVAIKLPLLIFLTLLVNGLINGLLAQVLGSGVTMRQSVQFLLTGFAIMATILGSLSPITLGIALQAPSPNSPNAESFHATILLVHTGIIAYAGIISHLSLLKFLRHFANTKPAGTTTFFAWILGNLFVGAQLSWVLRPFFGSPSTNTEFLRENPMQGTFYEVIWNSFLKIIS